MRFALPSATSAGGWRENRGVRPLAREFSNADECRRSKRRTGAALCRPAQDKTGEQAMDRRTFLKVTAGAGALAATGGLSTPAISQGAAARTLRFVPQANLANFDPIWGTQYVVRNASVLVWDTLYGFDDKLQPQRQMVESEETSRAGRTLRRRARPGRDRPAAGRRALRLGSCADGRPLADGRQR